MLRDTYIFIISLRPPIWMRSRGGIALGTLVAQWIIIGVGGLIKENLRFLPFLNLLRPGDPGSLTHFLNIFLGDLGIGVASFAPVIGIFFLALVDFNTGIVLGRGGITLVVLLRLLTLPSSWLELGAISLMAAEGITLAMSALKGRLVRELEVLWKVAIISIYMLLGSSFLEVTEEALRTSALLAWIGFVPFVVSAMAIYKQWIRN